MPKLLEPSAEWPSGLRNDFIRNQLNPCVGTRLLSQDKRVRVWEVRLRPSERLGFHRHVLDYFWVATTPGKARSHQQDGSVVEATPPMRRARPAISTMDPRSSKSTTWRTLGTPN
jgi:beta-alanine degradation protein BauB